MAAPLDDFRRRLEEEFNPEEPPVTAVSSIGRAIKPEGAAEMDAEFALKLWTAIPAKTVLRQAPSISTLSLKAFAYYLPAFLAAAAADPLDEGAAFVMYALAPLAHYDSYFRNTCRLFTPRQAGLVAEFLGILHADPSFVYMADELPPAIALWDKRSKELS